MSKAILPNKLSEETLMELHSDYQQSAKLVSLVYVEDSMPGTPRNHQTIRRRWPQ